MQESGWARITAPEMADDDGTGSGRRNLAKEAEQPQGAAEIAGFASLSAGLQRLEKLRNDGYL
eukprot:SAG31_NODE_45150_length_260_cov_0.633540_1_plen_62_part_01